MTVKVLNSYEIRNEISVFQNIFISEQHNKLNAFIQVQECRDGSQLTSDIISRNNQPAIHSKKESP